MGHGKNQKGQTMIYKALHRRLEIEQKEPLKSKVDSGDTVMKQIGLYRITISNFKSIILEMEYVFDRCWKTQNDRQEEFEYTKGVIRIRI